MTSPSPRDIPPIQGTNGYLLEGKENSVEANIEYSRSVRGLQVGPVPSELWNVVFTADIEVRQRPPKVDWSPVLKATTEADMYKPFVSALDMPLFFPNPRRRVATPAGSGHARQRSSAPAYRSLHQRGPQLSYV